ncbi:thiamine pyrophosphate-dependent enzyme [Amycolatopsis ultiminotia]|uniref:Thiamine pyrophosphate-dependent enzyme n=1 Tax=Amycolatopsis ultiminotia TaxID=543629 RepID=A0ABP6YBI7_9PSEU
MTTTTPMPGYARLPRLISLMTGDDKHHAAAESTVDVLWVLFDRVLRITPETVHDPDRDRFLLSKGHGPMAYYAVLAAKGFLDEEELADWSSARSRLGHHPDRTRVPGVEISSGSLGHGLPIALGTALGLRARAADARVVTLVGDAELDEGSNHEAIVVAARMGLDRLSAVVVDNQSSTHGWPGGIARRFETEGWVTRTVSGRDHQALYAACTTEHPGRPLAVVAVVEPKGGH